MRHKSTINHNNEVTKNKWICKEIIYNVETISKCSCMCVTLAVMMTIIMHGPRQDKNNDKKQQAHLYTCIKWEKIWSCRNYIFKADKIQNANRGQKSGWFEESLSISHLFLTWDFNLRLVLPHHADQTDVAKSWFQIPYQTPSNISDICTSNINNNNNNRHISIAP